MVARWWAQGQLTGVAGEAGGEADQSVPEGGDHGFAAADAVSGEVAVFSGSGGELV